MPGWRAKIRGRKKHPLPSNVMMPSEPDKKMEDLLRTYARKRREDAGEPPEMHPATRRLLQAEATKLRPREATSQPTFWSWFLLRWPRVGFAVGILALLTVVVWNGMLSRNESSSPTLFAKQDRRPKQCPRSRFPRAMPCQPPQHRLAALPSRTRISQNDPSPRCRRRASAFSMKFVRTTRCARRAGRPI